MLLTTDLCRKNIKFAIFRLTLQYICVEFRWHRVSTCFYYITVMSSMLSIWWFLDAVQIIFLLIVISKCNVTINFRLCLLPQFWHVITISAVMLALNYFLPFITVASLTTIKVDGELILQTISCRCRTWRCCRSCQPRCHPRRCCCCCITHTWWWRLLAILLNSTC